jgi:hypothetical protein
MPRLQVLSAAKASQMCYITVVALNGRRFSLMASFLGVAKMQKQSH